MSVRVGILSCEGAPLLGRLLAALHARNIPVAAVLMDERGMPEKNARIFAERTNGRLPPVPLLPSGGPDIPFHVVASHNAPDTMARVRDLGLDVLFSQVTPRILEGDILHVTPIGVINVHPGLLPKYRGATCVEWAIYNDEPVGLTAHLMNEEIDAGAIIRRRILSVRSGDTYTDIRVRVYEESVDLQADVAANLWNGAICPADFEPQGYGQFHQVIDDVRMAEVLRKIDTGAYARALAHAASND